MNIGITQRLFFSILAATSLVILSLFVIMGWSVNRGFYDYLGALDQVRLERIADQLGRVYAAQGSWDFLKARPMGWMRRMFNPQPEDGAPGRDGDALPPRGGRRGGWPFIVLDAERRPVMGNAAMAAEAAFRPVSAKGRVVGYVGLLPPKHFLTPPQIAFLKQQKTSLIAAAFGTALVIAVISLPLARRMVRPLRSLAAATHDISSGKYGTRVPVSSTDELGRLARDFNTMAVALEQHDQERRQWVAAVSHELRTPVAVLRGEIEALLDGVRSVTPDRVRSLHAETLRLGRLVDDLYQLALADLGALTFRREQLDLGEALRDALSPHREAFNRKGIAVTVSAPDPPAPALLADRHRLGQLFANLFENSLRYTDAGGALDVALTYDTRDAVIEFRDSAPGVPASELGRLFDRLYRVEGSRSRASGGAGLGLAICKSIVEAQGGKITAHPSPLGGLLVRITLPLEPDSAFPSGPVKIEERTS